MKGIYSQGFVVLTERLVELDELRPLLPEFPFLRTIPASERWEMGGASAIVSFRPEVNGLVVIDTVGEPWPDHMGDTKKEFMLFGAWTMGHFGPFAYPRGLERAVQQAWSWPEAKACVPLHRGFIRLRVSYCLGADKEAKVLPKDYQPRAELDFLTDLVRAVARHSAAICYFNPSGEVVAPANVVETNVTYHRKHELPPLNVWSNIRLFNMPDDWIMMDSVGNWQLDMADHEVVFPKGAFKPQDIDNFIRNASLYVLTNGAVIKDGNTMDGPGGQRFRGTTFENGLNDPPREVISWLPADARNVPALVSNRSPKKKSDDATAENRSWWKRWTAK